MNSSPLYSHPALTSFRQLVDHNALEYPYETAFQFQRHGEVVSVTYAQFKHDIEALASHFERSGLRRVKIAVLGENSYEWILTYFAAVLSDNIIVPIDKELPDEGIAQLLTFAGVDVLVSAPTYADTAQQINQNGTVKTILPMDTIPAILEKGDTIDIQTDKSALCAIIFTSGTTGKPKGVMLSQQALMKDAVAACQNVDITGPSLLTLPLHHICAFYTETVPVVLDTIKAAIRDRLPRYMMPHIFTKLDTLPLTPSGKVNRKALPEVDLTAIVSEVEYVAPSTEEETALATAVSQVLGLEQVGLLDNFFDLGGDSLKAIELTAALERSGYHTEVKTIFDAETLGALAAKLTAVQPKTEDEIPTGDIPATPAQMRIYTAQSMSGGTAYNVPYAFRVKELDLARLQTAVDKLVARHEILRTRFENRDGVIMQVTDSCAQCVVEKLPRDDFLAFIRPFDLETAPLLRVGYYENTVLLDMHHIITDGGSMPVFLRELNELYMGRELISPPVQYREFAAKKQDSSEDEAYWLGIFADEPPVLELNTDYPRPAKQSYEGAAVYEAIPAALHAQICEKCKALGVTPYAYYLGAFQILLSKFSGNEDIVVGTPISGRSGKFLTALGMFVNTLALRSRPEGEKNVRGFLDEIKTAAVDALAHQNYPYGDLVKKLGVHTEGRNPLFDVMFAYPTPASQTECRHYGCRWCVGPIYALESVSHSA